MEMYEAMVNVALWICGVSGICALVGWHGLFILAELPKPKYYYPDTTAVMRIFMKLGVCWFLAGLATLFIGAIGKTVVSRTCG